MCPYSAGCWVGDEMTWPSGHRSVPGEMDAYSQHSTLCSVQGTKHAEGSYPTVWGYLTVGFLEQVNSNLRFER